MNGSNQGVGYGQDTYPNREFASRQKKRELAGGELAVYDLIIIGMGPAGLTAAVYAARKKMSTLLLGKQYGGQMAMASGVENYMGFQYITGLELLSKFEEHVKQYPVERKETGVVKLRSQNGHFVTRTAGGEEFLSRTVIVAAGKVPCRLNVPGEKRVNWAGCQLLCGV